MIGNSLSHYQITAELGRGGMGIVYRATDTKLNRDVALKILPAAALASKDDRARFFREAQSAAQLHHPNIATVFEIDEAVLMDGEGNSINETDGPRPYIVMELIDGETLQEVIKKAPLSLADAVKVSSQVAEALKAAHAKDIVHRDIKSANVMITGDGVAKVLDFGLAKTNQSTMLTRMGSTLGTVAYMSPEQARGQEVDGRTDLYSLGTMMYEMVAGKLPFAGEYEQAVVYSILNEPPEPLTSVRTGVPMQLEWIIDKLLAKDADYRYQSAAGLLADLKSLDLSGSGHSRRSMAAVTGAVPAASSATKARAASKSDPKMLVGMAVGVLLLGIAGGWLLKPNPFIPEEPIRKFELRMPGMIGVEDPAGSPTGSYWAFSGRDSLGILAAYLWDVDQNDYSRIPGSERSRVLSFSPDGNWIALRGPEGISRARVPSGSAILVDSLNEGVWLDNERMVVIDDDSFEFWELAPETGERLNVPVSGIDSLYTDLGRAFKIPDRPALLINAFKESGEADLLVVDLEEGEAKVLVQDACCGKATKEGRILYLTALDGFAGKLVAQRFDQGTLSLAGLPVDLSANNVLRPFFGLGGDNSFFLNPRSITQTGGEGLKLSWLDVASNEAEMLDFPAGWYDRLSFSPDGRLVAMERAPSGELTAPSNIFVFDLETGTERQLTYTVPTNRVPVWSSDGKIYFAGGGFNQADIYAKNGDGTGSEEVVVENGDYPTVSSDGEWLVFKRPGNQGDLYALNLNDGTEVAIDTLGHDSGDPAISPDGRYIAYSASSESGNTVTRDQRVYVRSFPDPSIFFTQLVDGFADDPIWSEDGDYLYFRDTGRVFRVGVQTEGTFSLTSTPEDVVRFPGSTIRYGVQPGEDRILVAHRGTAVSREADRRFEVILSFSRYLDRLFESSE